MERDLDAVLNKYQRKNYANDFRRGWRWAYRTGLDGGKVSQNWSQDDARRYGLEVGLAHQNRFNVGHLSLGDKPGTVLDEG